ncbi:serine aminopeptidase domain-containing protein [Pseudonocardia acidicola]|uniref:Alpha/beta hydrolase n=1 Tax=Pseudonocardia acidicola TaxID=2724939 RepID=A0ABX1S8Q9_9PSEU|nr:alpha/beta hydrolase [Pseudonocardia acidicola]NMH97946.1 alpha/beta hydrolase [Pseudonocardia acidicola]
MTVGGARPEDNQTDTYLKRTRYTTFSSLPAGCAAEMISLFATDGAETRGMLYAPAGASRTVVCFSHPRVDVQRHFQIRHFLDAGYAVFAHNSRWLGNDVATTHEHLLLDIAGALRHLRGERGFGSVVLLGTSGGGSLYGFYQAQAATPPQQRLRDLPSGEPIDLPGEDMPVADGIILSAAHTGQGALLGRIIDPSVVDEADPIAVDPARDMFDPANGFRERPAQSRYSAEFLTAYRAAQHERVRRLDAMARAAVAEQRRYRDMLAEPGAEQLSTRAKAEIRRRAVAAKYMVVYRTTANPAYLDLRIEPSDRVQGGIWSAQPEMDNFGEWGLARLVTPRAWLSTWSAISSRARLVDNAAALDIPCLVTTGTADRDIYPSDSRAIHDAVPHADKSLVMIEGADHYLLPSGERGAGRDTRAEAADHVQKWMRERFEA